MSDLKTKTVKQLKEIAKKENLKGYSKLRKNQLINLILTKQILTRLKRNPLNIYKPQKIAELHNIDEQQARDILLKLWKKRILLQAKKDEFHYDIGGFSLSVESISKLFD